jgi:hypothetical protein
MTRNSFDTILNPYFKNAKMSDMEAYEMVVMAVAMLEAIIFVI